MQRIGGEGGVGPYINGPHGGQMAADNRSMDEDYLCSHHEAKMYLSGQKCCHAKLEHKMATLVNGLTRRNECWKPTRVGCSHTPELTPVTCVLVWSKDLHDTENSFGGEGRWRGFKKYMNCTYVF